MGGVVWVFGWVGVEDGVDLDAVGVEFHAGDDGEEGGGVFGGEGQVEEFPEVVQGDVSGFGLGAEGFELPAEGVELGFQVGDALFQGWA